MHGSAYFQVVLPSLVRPLRLGSVQWFGQYKKKKTPTNPTNELADNKVDNKPRRFEEEEGGKIL